MSWTRFQEVIWRPSCTKLCDFSTDVSSFAMNDEPICFFIITFVITGSDTITTNSVSCSLKKNLPLPRTFGFLFLLLVTANIRSCCLFDFCFCCLLTWCH